MILFMIACLLMNLQARKLASITVSAGTGIRIAYISDLHFDRILIQPSYLIKQICIKCPEVIVITGDLCTDLKYFERVSNFLDMLSYKVGCPILITLGNHDNIIFEKEKCTKEEYIAALESIAPNIRVLENETYLYKNVLFGGLGDVKTNREDFGKTALQWNKAAEKSNYKFILLTHNPDLILKLPRLCALTLLLAGHTHGGQVRLPLNIEFTLLKKDILPKKGIYYGFHTYNGMNLYITSGIGCSLLPIRFRSKAEIALIE